MITGGEEVLELKGEGIEALAKWILTDITKNAELWCWNVTVRGGQNCHKMESVILGSRDNYNHQGGRWYKLMAWASKLAASGEEEGK